MRTDEPGDRRQRLGQAGERAAEDLLRESGLVILERRYRTRYGELDLVARDGKLIVFVEVKARRGVGFGEPAEAVTHRKRRRMARAALAFLASRDWLARPCRFDVVAITQTRCGAFRLRHVADAFRLGPGDGAG